jgi:uncharacterized protein YuzE
LVLDTSYGFGQYTTFVGTDVMGLEDGLSVGEDDKGDLVITTCAVVEVAAVVLGVVVDDPTVIDTAVVDETILLDTGAKGAEVLGTNVVTAVFVLLVTVVSSKPSPKILSLNALLFSPW